MRVSPGNTPDRLVMHLHGLSGDDAEVLARDATYVCAQMAPKSSGRSARNLTPVWAEGYFGVKWLDCLVPGNRVLTDDLRWVDVADLHVGDGLIAPGVKRDGAWRRYEYSEVTFIDRAYRECVEIIFDDGFSTTCTKNHPWLANAGSPREKLVQRWVDSGDLQEGDEVGVYFDVWGTDETRDGGWLAGMFDGEGTMSTHDVRKGQGGRTSGTLNVAQNPGPVFDEMELLLKERGFDLGIRTQRDVHRIEIKGGFAEQARFLGSLRPIRLLPKLRFEGRPMRAIRRRQVVEVREVGQQEIVLMSTSSQTYMAEGMGSHNSYVWFVENGISPFTMRNLAGKTIPMWINDPTGEEARKNPKAEKRTTADGRSQILIFRKAAPIGSRKTVLREGRPVDVPRSWPGAPGRINRRHRAGEMYNGARIGGRIAEGNVGVRWRHPGLARRGFIRRGLEATAVYHGFESGTIRDNLGRIRG